MESLKKNLAIIQVLNSGLINIFAVKEGCEFYDCDTDDEEYFKFFHQTCLRLVASIRIEEYLSIVEKHQEQNTDPILRAVASTELGVKNPKAL